MEGALSGGILPPHPLHGAPTPTRRFHRVGGVGAECLHSAFKLQKKKLSREWAADSSPAEGRVLL